jgi:hypothetical protein
MLQFCDGHEEFLRGIGRAALPAGQPPHNIFLHVACIQQQRNFACPARLRPRVPSSKHEVLLDLGGVDARPVQELLRAVLNANNNKLRQTPWNLVSTSFLAQCLLCGGEGQVPVA